MVLTKVVDFPLHGSSFTRTNNREVVRKLFDDNSCSNKILKDGLSLLVDKGEKFRFWSEIFHTFIPLKQAFPRIFAFATNKTGVVADFYSWDEANWVLDVHFRRPSFVWEVIQWNSFLRDLNSLILRRTVKDELAWSYCPNGLFNVGSFRRCLQDVNSEDVFNFQLVSQVAWVVWPVSLYNQKKSLEYPVSCHGVDYLGEAKYDGV
ncbi:hypothetical protein Ddye_005768 [Dipteronia dyeriana]|uniref:Uncharacterized protein n=1 Tax=Dipteronia dyeriana TaxID=168575 RepID=A0AAD9XGQ6_9ROSI|nr:hypothetical protein Ddye_005768 [Dipteronia dyeriana]